MSGNVYHETSGDNEIIVNWNKAMAWIEHTHTHTQKQDSNEKLENWKSNIMNKYESRHGWSNIDTKR